MVSAPLRVAVVLAILALSPSILAQTAEPAPPPPPATSTAETPEPEKTPAEQAETTDAPLAAEAPASAVLSDAASSSYERRDGLPNVNIYLPEGQASVRLRKLIRNVLFESQIEYNFVNGDISTYLRYKYYARNYTYRLGVFDSIEFPDLGENSNLEFERVRGGLVLVGVPRNYNNRYFWLLQDDRLTFGDLTRVDNRKNNIYTKVGYQYGTQFDERLNAIVGETRGRLAPVLTAFRDIGSQRGGLAAALTYSGKVATGDYHYTKLEAEALHRFDITSTSFVFSRLHVGSFLQKDKVRGPEFDDWERYSIPRYELFRLGGREALKSVDNGEAQGSNEAHLTNELFVPIFRNRDYKAWLLHFTNLYGIGYVGAGTVGFDYDQIADSDRLTVDAGLGAETSITIRDFDVYLSVVYAKTLTGPEELRGSKVRFAIRTAR
jgi:hypothetical protein